MRLPIEDTLPQIIAALRDKRRAVLQAPPGAGKTTRVPLAMLDANLTEGRILMLEPRRLAARAAAARMAQTLSEPLGQTVGYRMRGDNKVSAGTRIEVVTEGILTRMIQSDPELPGIGAIIFDEFHERSLNADLGLALCLEIASTLRDDLLLLVMSATLDAAPIAQMMDAPVVTSKGRSFEVVDRWLDRPLPKAMHFEQACADLVIKAVGETKGGVLVFLPGEGEIRRVERALADQLPPDCAVRPLYGALPFETQRAAIAPVASGRKVVLSTSIAETSLTIDDIEVVVDGGRSRRARFDAGSGMSRLVTERVTKAEATQRAGRAGRVAPGVCYKLWTKGEDGALPAYPPAEIEAADLTGLALELAIWGTGPDDLAFVTAPNAAAFSEAQGLLQLLGALDAEGRVTPHGRKIGAMPVHPRLAHMLARAGKEAAPLAAVLSERDPLKAASVDVSLRVAAATDLRRFKDSHPYEVHRPTLERIKTEAKRLARSMDSGPDLSIAEMAALAYPDRIGMRRSGEAPRYVLSAGKGAYLPEGDALAGAKMIVATDLDGNPREAKVRSAVSISEAEVRSLFADQIEWVETCEWSKRDRRVLARKQLRLGALVLEDHVWTEAPVEAMSKAMIKGVKDLGLHLSGAAARLAARVERVRATGVDLPDMSAQSLSETLEDWLMPHLSGITTAEDWKGLDLKPALSAMLDWGQTKALDDATPSHFETPLGRRIAIDYSNDTPEIKVRLQELFGVTRHPVIAGEPLKITLLSPAQRPVQVTTDLPAFWTSSYADVRKDMRGRYPRHPWPEDPTQADPTQRAKPRGT